SFVTSIATFQMPNTTGTPARSLAPDRTLALQSRAEPERSEPSIAPWFSVALAKDGGAKDGQTTAQPLQTTADNCQQSPGGSYPSDPSKADHQPPKKLTYLQELVLGLHNGP
ncbi:MAG: hypothetical protein U0984_07650, partial [Prosthecobacter sp.]|nr:hypothetical protein [Prosthecobacter sp.]